MSVAYAGYRVVAGDELGRRVRAAAEDNYRRVVAEAQRVSQSIAAARTAFGLAGVEQPVVARVGRRATAEHLAAAAQATQAAIAAARVGYEAAMAAARAQAMTASVAPITSHGLADDAAAERQARIAARRPAEVPSTSSTSAATPAPAIDAGAAAADERRDRVRQMVARLPAEVPGDALPRVEAAAAQALAAVDDPVAFARALDRVRMVVQTISDADRDRRDALAQVERWRAELDGLEGQVVARVRARLDQVDPLRPLPSDLASAVRSAANDARAARDRSFALDALAETLDELGYAVDHGFATSVAGGGAVVPLPHSNHHGVQVRERDGHVFFNVVRYADGDGRGDAVADRNAEAHWCSGYDRLVALAHDKGVVLEMSPPGPPGHQPLQHVAPPASRNGDREIEERHDAVRERGR